jgi:hypothetical protein
MSVNVKIEKDENQQTGAIKIKIVADSPEPVQVELNARRALNGDIMIFDHDLIDVVISPEKNKITSFPKDIMKRETYPVQESFHKFLVKKGIIDPSSIQSGNVYSSIESSIYESKIEGINAVQSALFITSLFMQNEKADILTRQDMQRNFDLHLLSPDEENSTELGEIPQSDRKGSMDSRVSPYGYQYMYSLLREREDK